MLAYIWVIDLISIDSIYAYVGIYPGYWFDLCRQCFYINKLEEGLLDINLKLLGPVEIECEVNWWPWKATRLWLYFEVLVWANVKRVTNNWRKWR